MTQFLIGSFDEFLTQARTLAQKLAGGEVIGLIGPLGSGKTTFVKALGRELKIKIPITSPSFVLMHRFPVRLKTRAKKNFKGFLYHLDLYRTKNFKELKPLGLEEFWTRKDTIVIIEWADKIQSHLPKNTLLIKFNTQAK